MIMITALPTGLQGAGDCDDVCATALSSEFCSMDIFFSNGSAVFRRMTSRSAVFFSHFLPAVQEARVRGEDEVDKVIVAAVLQDEEAIFAAVVLPVDDVG